MEQERNKQNGMAIKEFVHRLYQQLNCNPLIYECDIVSFLKKWNIVEVFNNDKYVQLHASKEMCTVFLKNLKSKDWNQEKIRSIMTNINPQWDIVEITVQDDINQNSMSVFIEFLSLADAQNAKFLLEKHNYLFENKTQQHNKHIADVVAVNSLNPVCNQASCNSQHILCATPSNSVSDCVQSDTKSCCETQQMPYSLHSTPQTQPQVSNNNSSLKIAFQQIHLDAQNVNIQIPFHCNNNQENMIPHSKNNSNKSENSQEFQEIMENIYHLIRSVGGKMRMSEISKEYEKNFNKPLNFNDDPKYFVRMERLLLLNCDKGHSDVMIFYTPEPAYKLVVSVLKQNTDGNNVLSICENKDNNNAKIENQIADSNNDTNDSVVRDNLFNHGIPVTQFRTHLEQKMGMSLDGCDFNDFLMRWRFLSIRINDNGEKVVLFTPHQNGTTVFFGNLNPECNENDIYQDLEKADTAWKYSSVRLKFGKGFAYAFVDFPTREDALRAVKYFDERSAFKSKRVSADIEAVDQKRMRTRNNDAHDASNTKYDHQCNNVTNNGNNHRQSILHDVVNKTTVYLGNLKDDVTKKQIQGELASINSSWETLPTRLNLRNGWSHAFLDFEDLHDAKRLIHLWHNKCDSLLTNVRLRCEISKRQHV